MITISITASMLCDLLQKQMTYTACEALVGYLEEADVFDPDNAPTIGDIAISFSEVAKEDVEEGDYVIAELDNGNALIAR